MLRKSKRGALLPIENNPRQSKVIHESDLSSYVSRRFTSHCSVRALLENAASQPHGKVRATFMIRQRVRPRLAKAATRAARASALERLPRLEYKEDV
jgi:hypothetical protein